MLVFLSDLHFTDGTAGKANVAPRAFEYLRDDLAHLASHPENQIESVEIVLLGDVFDLLRSDKWDDESVMPWGPHNQEMEARVGAILDGICTANAESLALLRELPSHIAAPCSLTYVPGNHDRAVNWFPSARQKAMDALGLSQPADAEFLREFACPEHRVLARHGDIYDGDNYEGEDKSSVGDAIVIKIINGFARQLDRRLQGVTIPPDHAWVREKVKELDHVRPLWAIPLWAHGIFARIHNDAVRQAVRESWDAAAHDFQQSDPVRAKEHWWNPFQRIDLLERALHLSWGLLERATAVPFIQRRIESGEQTYLDSAAQEAALTTEEADTIVYGHTHGACQVPLDVRGGRPTMYFNTGTWRHTINAVARPTDDRYAFIPWQVMSYVILYRPGECARAGTPILYEMWQGMRG
jgi:UDP-2,3-diacylglucosamine pyrophosphatase LpxH